LTRTIMNISRHRIVFRHRGRITVHSPRTTIAVLADSEVFYAPPCFVHGVAVAIVRERKKGI